MGLRCSRGSLQNRCLRRERSSADTAHRRDTLPAGGSPMPKTPLYDTLAASGAQMGQYAGVETATRFGEVAEEFRQLTHSCAIYDLGWRAKIMLTGADRTRWVNGMVTNNIKDLPQN